jgi:hypothetical protein
LKHIQSIEQWARNGKLSSGETIISRLDDARNYMDILESLIYENENWREESTYYINEETKK